MSSRCKHPKTYGQIERVYQLLEAILTSCIIDHTNKGGDLPLLVIAHNSRKHLVTKFCMFQSINEVLLACLC